ncbi:MAG TPA: hypothetical protein VG273_05335 [Bryobacteraceae bacterium]|jgi:hypothetical protein|nr:hypothetical protein [Bryobacteraceae bacterium]
MSTPDNLRVKAGDSAPDFSFVKTLSAPHSASWTMANLSGNVTVIAFFPDTSHNLQSVSRWNALADSERTH